MSHTTNLLEYLILSLLAAILLTVLIAVSPASQPIHSGDTLVVAVAFNASCILGLALTLKPRWFPLLRIPQRKTQDYHVASAHVFRGHHPDCAVFQSHILQRNQRTWCAGCLGIAIGLLIGMGIATVEALSPIRLTPALFWLGLGYLLIVVVFGELVLGLRRPVVHLMANSLLGPGFAIVVFVTVQQSGSFIFGLFALLLTFLWMDARVQWSRWRHEKLCVSCGEACKSYPRPSVTTSGDPDAHYDDDEGDHPAEDPGPLNAVHP